MSRSLLLSVAVLAAFVAVAHAGSGVLDLTASNFDSAVDGSKPAFVEFFAPWCGHCKSLAPEYEKVGATFSTSDGVVVAKVDADAHRELASRFGVSGYPTLKWFPKGSTQPEDYQGGRSAEDIVEFINDKTGLRKRVQTPPSDVVTLTSSNFNSIVHDPKKDVLVEFYAPWCGHCKSLAPTYEKVATDFAAEENVVVAKLDATKHSDVASKYDVAGYPTIKFFPRGSADKTPQDYTGGRDEKSFVEFLNTQAGTQRTEGGGLGKTAGRVAELDAIVSSFTELTEEGVAALRNAVASLSGDAAKHAQHYMKVAEKVLEKGAAYVEQERARLDRMISSEAVKPQKKTLFMLRRNILDAFTA